MRAKLLIFIMLCVCMASVASAEIGASAGVDFVSKYVWRGFNLSDGANTQPGVELSVEGLTLGYWGSFNWEAEDSNLEQDLYIGYDFSVLDDFLGVSVGYTYYKFPSAGDAESGEFWLGFSLEELPLSPSLTFYFDVGDEKDGGGDGKYISLSVGHDFEVSDAFSISLGASAGYINELFIMEKGMADFVPSISFSYTVNDNVSIGLSGNYSTVIDSDVETAMGADDEFFAVLNITVS